MLSRNSAGDKAPPSKLATYNGGTDPYPVPWLDKNGSHNQPAGPQLEPSHIYHFKGLTLHRNGITNIDTSREAAAALMPLAGAFAATLFTVRIVGVGLVSIPTLIPSAAYAWRRRFAGTTG